MRLASPTHRAARSLPLSRARAQFPEAVLREIKILRQLRFHVREPHPNIILLRNIVLHRQKGAFSGLAAAVVAFVEAVHVHRL